jgi:hypothetical protein
MRIFDFANQERLFFQMDELPPSGLQNLHQGFRLVVQLVVPPLRFAQGRNFPPCTQSLLGSQMVL